MKRPLELELWAITTPTCACKDDLTVEPAPGAFLARRLQLQVATARRGHKEVRSRLIEDVIVSCLVLAIVCSCCTSIRTIGFLKFDDLAGLGDYRGVAAVEHCTHGRVFLRDKAAALQFDQTSP